MTHFVSVGSDRLRLLRNGEQALPALYAAIAAASHEIALEMYWIGADRVGKHVRDLLVERAKAGVTVRVIYDAFGSIGLSEDFFSALVDAGGAAVPFHALWPFSRTFRVGRLDQRDHRKLLVVDGKHMFLGGLNLTVQWHPLEDGGGGWRDDVIELVGPTASEGRALFYKTWKWLTGEPAPPDVRPLRRTPGPVGLYTSQRGGKRNLRAELLRLFSKAHNSICISNPYFVPDYRMRRALYRARERGVHVRILLPVAGDVPLVQSAAEGLFDKFLRNGIELYQWHSPFMHNKTILIDSETTIAGSFNFDERSVRNLELDIKIRDRVFNAIALRSFEEDIAKAHRLQLGEWRGRALSRQLVESFALSFRRLL